MILRFWNWMWNETESVWEIIKKSIVFTIAAVAFIPIILYVAIAVKQLYIYLGIWDYLASLSSTVMFIIPILVVFIPYILFLSFSFSSIVMDGYYMVKDRLSKKKEK